MTALLAFDSASPWDEQRLTQIKQRGGIAVSFYIRGNPGGFRHASKADVDMARSMGLGALPNWESTADFFAHCSLAEAKAAGVEARQSAQALGFPDDGTITLPFSFDYQIPAAGLTAALARLNACQDGLGDTYRAAAYGQSNFLAYLGHNGYGDRGHWLMASTFQQSSNIPQPSTLYDIGSPFVAMVQSHHADGSWFDSPIPGTDVNTVTRPDRLAAWWPDGSPYGDNMPSVDDIFKYVVITEDGNEITFKELLRGLRARSLALTPQSITAAVVAKLPDDAGGGLTRAQVATALESELVSFFGKAVNS